MSPENWLALIGVFATLAGGLVYAIRKWTDVKEKQAHHELDMQKMAVKHEHDLEDKRDEREKVRAERDMQTATYIATNTAALLALQKDSEAQIKVIASIQEVLDKTLGNGLVTLLSQNMDCTSLTYEMTKDVLQAVQRIEEKMLE